MTSKTFTDSDGLRWSVREVVIPVGDRRPGTPLPAGTTGVQPRFETWLYFETENETRRLTPIPDDWAEAGDGQLRWWLTRAKPVPKA